MDMDEPELRPILTTPWVKSMNIWVKYASKCDSSAKDLGASSIVVSLQNGRQDW